MFHKLLNRIEIRYGRYRGIRNLMSIIIAGMAVTYLADLILGPVTGIYLSQWFAFNRELILRGQLWRLLTFVFTSPSQQGVLYLLQLVFIYFTGNMLQNQWGILRFNLFYFCGMLGTLLAGMITGYATGYYVNLSLLLAVAMLFPQMQVNLYGLLPISMKWLALVELLLLLPGIVNGTWGIRGCILVSLLNVLLFMEDRLMKYYHEAQRRRQWKKNWRGGQWR